MTAPAPFRQSAPEAAATPVHRRVRALAVAALVLVGYAATVPGLPQAAADTAPATGTPATVSADELPTVQVDGVVWSQGMAGNRVIAGGKFATARPAGALAGVSTTPRNNLVAFDIRTGVMDPSFAPSTDAQVLAVAVSPDARTVYIGGDFTKVNGVLRNRLAALDATTGALLPWAPGASTRVWSLAATATSVYAGGDFTSIATPVGTTGIARTYAAALDPATGALQSFAPTIGGTSGQSHAVRAITVSPDGTKVMLGGQFETVDGRTTSGGYGLALVDAPTGKTSYTIQANQTRVRNAKNNAGILSLATAPDGVYGTGFAFGSPPSGTLEGTFKADWNGTLTWIEDCHGDSYSVFPIADTVYVAGHPHYCGNIGGFEDTNPFTNHQAVAFTTDARVTIGKEPTTYNNFYGLPAPKLLSWFPDFTIGKASGQNQATWHVTGNSDYLSYGGEFPTVNGVKQQGLVRFARTGLAPNTEGPRLKGADFVPVAQNFAQGVRLRWTANHDRDNELLTYKLIRNGNTTTPVCTVQQTSTFFQRPTLACLDTTRTIGQTYTYRVQVSDPKGNTAVGNDITVTAAAGASLSSYDQRVLADAPQSYWRMAETSGTAAGDLAGTVGPATRRAGVTTGVPGAISGDAGTAYRFNGSSTGFFSTDYIQTGKQLFSTEAWIKTTSATGGLVLSFGNAKTGSSTITDRQIYVTPTGQVQFGTNPTVPKTVSSTAKVNDGTWHHVVGTNDMAGLKLYVDGALVDSRNDGTQPQRYNGYWRVGGDAVSGWPGNPTTGYFTGDIDDAAVYDKVLTAAQVSTHYTTGRGNATNSPPTASFSSSTSGLSASLDASASTDPDGSIASYAWTFGDGTTGTGISPTHTYDSAASYTVGLTVTDNRGATATTSKTVTVTAPASGNFAADTFNRTVASGFGTADTGGTWTAPSTASVSGGAGVLKMGAAGSGPEVYLNSTLRTSADVTTNVSLDKLGTGGGVTLSTYGRRISSVGDYRADVVVSSTGVATISLASTQGGTKVTLASAVKATGTVAPGTVIHTRVQVTGTNPTTVRAKLWLGSAAEPSAWTVTGTANSYAALQAPGAVGMKAYLSGSATNAPVNASLLDIAAQPVG